MDVVNKTTSKHCLVARAVEGCRKNNGQKVNTFLSRNTKKYQLTLLVRILEGPGGRRAILPGLRGQIVIKSWTSGHRLCVEISRERAILHMWVMSIPFYPIRYPHEPIHFE